ncbi:hypothetical protein TCON_2568 [Astathelohania contejeani]|uniref:Uncharacterized protein n=1 Tax=Astathelohania contejeani TaxID=164912 RepID=A0ABQ7HVM9_9MICR|nr:hypothetical protein TCON_2568 [Thelohania contejeani]
MFRGFSFTPRHQAITKAIYTSNYTVDEQKLSYFIYYLKSKVDRIQKVLRYMNDRTLKELKNTGHMYVSARILQEVINELKPYSINYETEILRIFVNGCGEILRARKGFVFCEELLETITLFFSTVTIKTYKCEKYISVLLKLITGAIENNHVVVAQREPNEEEESSDQADLLKSIRNRRKELEAGVYLEYDLFCLNIIQTISSLREQFYNHFDEKYRIIIGCLIIPEDINKDKRNEILVYLIKNTNMLNSPALIYYFLLFSSRLSLEMFGMLCDNIPTKHYSFIIIQINNILMENGLLSGIAALKRNKMKEEKICDTMTRQLLIRWASDLIAHTEVCATNVAELAKSFFSILKILFHQTGKAKPDENPGYIIATTNTQCTISPEPPLIFNYLRLFLDHSSDFSTIFLLFVKMAFKYDFNRSDKHVTVYSRSFQVLILSEIRLAILRSKIKCVSSDVLGLLFRIEDKIGELCEACWGVMLALTQNGLFDRAGPTDYLMRMALVSRLRLTYWKTAHPMILQIFSLGPGFDDATRRMLNAKGYNNRDLLGDITVCGEYDPGADEEIVADYWATNAKEYSQSVKSSINLENLPVRRKRSAHILDIFK